MRIFLTVVFGLTILLIGVWFLSAIASRRPTEVREGPEDVGDLDVFFVCGECGTEFRVERLGELQVPRHCGETMLVEQRPRTT